VILDGVRFLRVILGTVFAYFPMRVFAPLAAICLAMAAGLAITPVRGYLRSFVLEDAMIYRLLTVLTLSVCGAVFAAIGLLAQKASNAALGRPSSWLDRASVRETAALAGGALWLTGVGVNWPTMVEYARTAHITRHWSWVLIGALAVICGTVLVSLSIALGAFAHFPTREDVK
jgi:hypothetical protein